jgi:hypothetical protein
MIFIRLQCDHCDFKKGVRRDTVPYAFWKNQAHGLRHPFEESDLAKLTKLSWDDAVSQGVVQRMNDCICFDCTASFSLDVERVVKRCPKCESYNVKTSRASLGAECPACRLGKLESSFVVIS